MNIIKSFFNLMVAKGYGPFLVTILCLIAIISILRIVFWIYGIRSLPYICRRRKIHSGLNPYLPCGGQLRSTLMLAGKDHALRASAHYIWWFFTCFFIICAAGVWYYNALRLQYAGIIKTILLSAIILSALIMLALYFLLRRAEFFALRKMLTSKTDLRIALLGMIFLVPVHRYFFYKNRRKLSARG